MLSKPTLWEVRRPLQSPARRWSALRHPGLRPLCPLLLCARGSSKLRADGGGILPGSGPEKVLPNPTWAMFAVSGLVAWLIDNRLCIRPFAFVLIFIPTGDISSVPCCPCSDSQAGMLGWVLGTAFVQLLKNSGWRERKRPGLGTRDAKAGRAPGLQSGRRRWCHHTDFLAP